MQHHIFEIWIDGVSMPIPVSRVEIEFDRAAPGGAVFEAHGRVEKIGTGPAIPHAELHDLNRPSVRVREMRAEIAREPARLPFDF